MQTLLDHWVLVCGGAVVLWILLKSYSRQRIAKLSGKAVLITGGTGDFGGKLAKRLDDLGVTVYAGARAPDGDAAMRLKAICSSRLHVLKLDVTKDDQVTEAVRTVTATLGDKKLWAVVNNAGVVHNAGFEWTPIETVKNMVDTNLLGIWRVTTAFLPLLKQSSGRILMVTSLAGYLSLPGGSAYCMTKGAVLSLADGIRRELAGWSVSVHILCPYLYSTRISSPETLIEGLESSWETAASKNSYPSTYLADYKKVLAVFLSLGRSNESVSEVVDDMVDAVVGKHPKILYVPGIIGKMFYFLCGIMPTSVIDYVFYLTAPATQEKQRNRLLDFLYSKMTGQNIA